MYHGLGERGARSACGVSKGREGVVHFPPHTHTKWWRRGASSPSHLHTVAQGGQAAPRISTRARGAGTDHPKCKALCCVAQTPVAPPRASPPLRLSSQPRWHLPHQNRRPKVGAHTLDAELAVAGDVRHCTGGDQQQRGAGAGRRHGAPVDEVVKDADLLGRSRVISGDLVRSRAISGDLVRSRGI